LKKGKSPFTETHLRKFIEPHIKRALFSTTTNIRKASVESDIIIIGVAPPIDKKKKPDYTKLEKLCRDVGMSLKPGSLIIFQNTMGPGMTETFAKENLEDASGLRAGVDFGLAYSATLDYSQNFTKNIANGKKVIGGITKRSLKIACLIHSIITNGEIIRVKDMKTAEAIKLLGEAYRDVNIAFANELAQFCEKAEIDFVKIRDIISPNGFSKNGGLHIPKDSYFLVEEAEALEVKLRLLSVSAKINDQILNHVIRLIRDALRANQRNLRRARIAVFGVSALPNKKKVTNSPIKKLVNRLKKSSVIVQVYDPFFSSKELLDLGYSAHTSMSKTVEGCDCLVIAVAHERFSRLNLRRLRIMMKDRAALVDIGQVINPIKAEKAGFVYRGFGRGIWTK
jgi:nucleotide sugar dehydrogenase